MKNADLPAMPITEEPFAVGAVSGRHGPLMFGLTKREMFAMHFHAALLAKESSGSLPHYIAVREADALLEELEK